MNISLKFNRTTVQYGFGNETKKSVFFSLETYLFSVSSNRSFLSTIKLDAFIKFPKRRPDCSISRLSITQCSCPSRRTALMPVVRGKMFSFSWNASCGHLMSFQWPSMLSFETPRFSFLRSFTGQFNRSYNDICCCCWYCYHYYDCYYYYYYWESAS